MGPLYVKFGQSLSTRPDLLPPDIAEELAKLQDNVPAFPAEQAKKEYKLPYPLIGCYSDIFVIDKSSIREFCHLCGVFATLRLHVEIAIPSALIFSASSIVVEKNIELNLPDGLLELQN